MRVKGTVATFTWHCSQFVLFKGVIARDPARGVAPADDRVIDLRLEMRAHRVEVHGIVEIHAELVRRDQLGDREDDQRAEALVMEAGKMETRPML